MKWTAQQKIRIGFWLLTLIPAVLGIIAYRSAGSMARASVDVADTNELVRSLENLLSLLKDVEVAQREYVLTGDERNVHLITELRDTIRSRVTEIRSQTRQREWMSLLDPVIPQKFEEIRKTIELRRAGDIQGALRLITGDKGAKPMDDIRTVFRNLIREETELLDQRSALQEKGFVTTMFLFAMLLLLNVSLIWAVAFVSQREADRIHQLNAELERRVAARTEALQRSNEDLQQFAYVASHDLKEPLRMISSYTALLQRKYQGKLDEEADTFISFIVGGAKRMEALIKDLLEYSKADETREESLATVECEQVVRNVLTNLRVTIAESGAQITWDRLPYVVYDPVRLSQIFQNLLANGIKYRGERKPRIHISAREMEGETLFSVKDNGMGMDPERTEEIFGIFKRLHGKDYEGTGIGLAMCKKIVERQGGRIWAESVPGEGSTFCFTIPRSRPATAHATTS
jgi:signal transduction histidine kinase